MIGAPKDRRRIDAHCEACSSWCSNTSLAARSRSWAELFTCRRPYDCSLD